MTFEPILVIYEVDPSNERSTGHVHTFCSEVCREAFTAPAPMGEVRGLDPGEYWGADTICETCDKPILEGAS